HRNRKPRIPDSLLLHTGSKPACAPMHDLASRRSDSTLTPVLRRLATIQDRDGWRIRRPARGTPESRRNEAREAAPAKLVSVRNWFWATAEFRRLFHPGLATDRSTRRLAALWRRQ